MPTIPTRLQICALSATAALALGSLTAPSASGGAAASPPPTWVQVTSPGAGPFRGIAAVSRTEAWVGNDDGDLWHTTDGGASWKDAAPPDSDLLGFRRIVPLGHGRVVLFARGGVDDLDGEEPSRAARIFLSPDSGRTWRQTFVNDDPAAFYDCLDMFADGRHGLAVSDPVGGRFRVLGTADGGRTWRVRPTTGMPAAVDGEFAIASGRCLQTSAQHEAWFGTAFAAARVFHSTDGGWTWTATESTLPADPDPTSGAGGGVWGLSVRGRDHVLAVGGTFADLDQDYASASSTRGGAWRAGGSTGGARFSVAWVPGRADTAVAGGFDGTDLTRDGGRTWTTFSTLPYEAVACAPGGVCWGTGEDGTVGRLVLG